MRLGNKRPLTGRSRGPARLLKGRCSLEFEGQRFVADSEPGREYWLELSEGTRASLDELLKPRGWLEWDEFEVEFYGSLEWVGWGCGHLGVFGGLARIDEVVAVHFRSPPVAAAAPCGIRGRIPQNAE